MSRVRAYSRRCITLASQPLPTGLSPSAVTRSSGLRFTDWTTRRDCRPLHASRTTPRWHRRQAVPPPRFGLLPVRSPLLRESSLLLGVLRCFSSPGALQHCCWWLAVRQPGCPIRISPAHRLPAPPRSISPRGRVLLRLPPPRHPPCAHTRQSPLVTSTHAPPRYRDGASARQRRRGFPRPASREPSPPAPTGWARPDVTARSRRNHIFHSLDEIGKLQNTTNYLQCARTTEQARSSRSTESVLRGCSVQHKLDPGPHPRPQSLSGTTRRIVKVLSWHRSACGPCGSGCSPTGGAAGIRTPDLRRARAALSRLSYGPAFSPRSPRPSHGHSSARGWARLDSNQGPRPYQGRALTT